MHFYAAFTLSADIQSVPSLCAGMPGLLHSQYLRCEELSCSCPCRLSYKMILQIWPWGVVGGADGRICKPVSQVSSGIVQVTVKHNTLQSACCHLKHWSFKQLTCHTLGFHLTESWIKETHIRSVGLYWYQINPKLGFLKYFKKNPLGVMGLFEFSRWAHRELHKTEEI